MAELGSWRGSDFRSIALDTLGLGVDADMPPAERFVRGVASLVQRVRARLPDDGASQVSVFLLSPTVPQHERLPDARREPMLNSGRVPIAGRLWFVNPPVVSGFWAEPSATDDDELFRLITDDLELGTVPAVIVDHSRDGDSIRFYPDGLSDPDACVVSSVEFGRSVDLDLILRCIDRAYDRFLKTPSSQDNAGKLWTSNRPKRSHHEAEGRIQVVLSAELHGALWTCDVRTEQPGPAGRLDVIVEEVDPTTPGHVVRHAVLELKVLRHLTASGEVVSDAFNDEHVRSGVEQAAAYQQEMHAAQAALCCFDQRPDGPHDCFGHVRTLAGALDVTLRSWHLFSSAREYQRFEATRRSTS